MPAYLIGSILNWLFSLLPSGSRPREAARRLDDKIFPR